MKVNYEYIRVYNENDEEFISFSGDPDTVAKLIFHLSKTGTMNPNLKVTKYSKEQEFRLYVETGGYSWGRVKLSNPSKPMEDYNKDELILLLKHLKEHSPKQYELAKSRLKMEV